MCEATYWHSDNSSFQVKTNILKIVECCLQMLQPKLHTLMFKASRWDTWIYLLSLREQSLLWWKMKFKYIALELFDM